MATQNTPESQADARDARIAELEAQLAATKEAAAQPEATVKLKHKNGTVVHVGKSQVERLKAAGFTK